MPHGKCYQRFDCSKGEVCWARRPIIGNLNLLASGSAPHPSPSAVVSKRERGSARRVGPEEFQAYSASLYTLLRGSNSLGNYIAAQELRGILRKMAGDDLRKTVEIVQGSWQKIVLQSAFYTACIGREWQLSLRFDARRAQTQRSWSPCDAPTALHAPLRGNRDRRDPRGPRASDFCMSQDPHLKLAHAACRARAPDAAYNDGGEDRAPRRRSTRA